MLALSKKLRHKRLGEWVVKTLIRKAANAETSGAAGGFLVPEELRVGIDAGIEELSFFHQHGYVQPMTGKTCRIPLVDPASATSGGSPLLGGLKMFWVGGDGLAPTESEPSFASGQLVARELGGYALVSNQLVDDGGEPLGAYLENLFAKAAAFYINKACFMGTGVADPLGIVNAPGSSLVARNAGGTISNTDLSNMLDVLLPASFPYAWWCCSGAAYGTISGLSGFTPGAVPVESKVVPGVPRGTLRGVPIHVSEVLPDLGTLGDLILIDPRLCVLGERQEIEVATTKEFPAAFLANQSVFRVWWRGDFQPLWQTTGTLANTEAGGSPFVVLQT